MDETESMVVSTNQILIFLPEISARVVQHIGRASGVVFVGLGVGLAVSSPTSGNSAERPDQ
jgi:hypothetical protein